MERKLHPGERLDNRSFEKLFREYFPPLMAFARRFLPDEDDAREVVQKVFINLWERREELDLSISLKSYLYTSVHNRSLNVIRDRKKFIPGDVPEAAGEWDANTRIESMELEQKVREAIDTLPEKCREIFELNRFGGLKYAEIAEKLGISVKTVENQMTKALRILREKLLNYLTLVMWLIIFAMN